MGRLFDRLSAEIETAPPANLANPLIHDRNPARISRISRLAAAPRANPQPQGHAPATNPPVHVADQSARLLAAIRAEGLPDSTLGRDDADPAELATLPDATIKAYVRALAESAEMEAGKVPAGYTVAAHCDGCGPVWLFVGAERVKACPWCWHRIAGRAIPRPPVNCGECRHFIPNPVNPPGGLGTCGIGAEYYPGERPRYPFTDRRCPQHRPADEAAPAPQPTDP